MIEKSSDGARRDYEEDIYVREDNLQGSNVGHVLYDEQALPECDVPFPSRDQRQMAECEKLIPERADTPA